MANGQPSRCVEERMMIPSHLAGGNGIRVDGQCISLPVSMRNERRNTRGTSGEKIFTSEGNKTRAIIWFISFASSARAASSSTPASRSMVSVYKRNKEATGGSERVATNKAAHSDSFAASCMVQVDITEKTRHQQIAICCICMSLTSLPSLFGRLE